MTPNVQIEIDWVKRLLTITRVGDAAPTVGLKPVAPVRPRKKRVRRKSLIRDGSR